jgi:hypothetical protein
MSDRITTNTERVLTTTVNDIEHIESQSLNGVAVVKIFFRPSANIQTALAQVAAVCQTILRSLPAGSTPPLVIEYSASSVPRPDRSTARPRQQPNDCGSNSFVWLDHGAGSGGSAVLRRKNASGCG